MGLQRQVIVRGREAADLGGDLHVLEEGAAGRDVALLVECHGLPMGGWCGVTWGARCQGLAEEDLVLRQKVVEESAAKVAQELSPVVQTEVFCHFCGRNGANGF